VSSDDPAFSWTEAEKDLMEGIDTSVPHSARIWNYWLGGRDNYSVDRQAGDEFCKIYPGIVDDARAYRQFIARTVQYLAGAAGIRQFLDIGTGLPTAENTHEVAQRVAPTSRVVYVDNDPLVLAHARALLTSTPEGVTNYIDADLREPAGILSAAAMTLDFNAPSRSSSAESWGISPTTKKQTQSSAGSWQPCRRADDSGFDEFEEFLPTRASSSATSTESSSITLAWAVTSASNSSRDNPSSPAIPRSSHEGNHARTDSSPRA
jgi:hypothetical protein